VTGLHGNVTGLHGNIDDCDLSDAERLIGFEILQLLKTE